MVKLIGKAYAKEGMSREAFVDYWLNKHAPLVKQLQGSALKKYVIDIVLAAEGEEPGYQGTVEVWYDSMETLQETMSSPAGKQGLEDVTNFVRKWTYIVIEEHTII